MEELKESKNRILSFLRKNSEEEYIVKNIAKELKMNVFKTREAVDGLVEDGEVNSEIREGKVYYSIAGRVAEESVSRKEEKTEKTEEESEEKEDEDEEEFEMKEHTFIKDDDDSIITF